MKLINKFIYYLQNKNILIRKLILIIIDSIILILSLLISLWLLGFKDFVLKEIILSFLILYVFVGVPYFIRSGEYREISRYIGSKSIYLTAIRTFVFIVVYALLSSLFIKINYFPKFIISFWFLTTSSKVCIRILYRDFFLYTNKLSKNKIINVAIYGAGSAGAQLSSTLSLCEGYNVRNFIDDNIKKTGLKIGGISIIKPDTLLDKLNYIDKVFLAIPSLKAKRRKEIIESLLKYNIPVMEVPSFDEIVSGSRSIDSIRPIDIEDLLSRSVVSPSKNLLKKSIENQSVLVTGAGGSIGSQLCMEILKLKPKKLIMVDISEPNLYEISNKIKKLYKNIDKASYLLDIQNRLVLEQILNDNKVNIIFHSAAYKHVPIVESNPISGIKNNVIATKTLCDCALKKNVGKVILISTDKAVRPTNIMGASKRLAELIIQAFDEKNKELENKNKTIFSIVRFGNVLGSSGSVVPLFKKQIEEGGPITLTNSKILRFFMTIKEAAELVLQASSLSEGGDLFLLDMGKPVLIKDLAKKMIALSGLTLKDKNNINGDIEILITGLRPGEKIKEELLIEGKPIKTKHPLIYKSKEKHIPYKDLFFEIDLLEKIIAENNRKKVILKLKELVPEWVQSKNILN